MRETPPSTRQWRKWALFLDIDGTLLDLAPTPDGVVIPEGLPATLANLSEALGGALALVSGRSLSAIDRLFGDGIDAAGTHGHEWRYGGMTFTSRHSCPIDLRAVLAAEVGQMPGVMVEHKPHAVALHYRAAPEQRNAVRALAEATARAAAMRVIHGKAVTEIVPADEDKGSAIERFLRQPRYANRIPVFIGDDVTDEEGFRAVNRLGGISAHVGENAATDARFRFASPARFRTWLGSLAQECVHKHQ